MVPKSHLFLANNFSICCNNVYSLAIAFLCDVRDSLCTMFTFGVSLRFHLYHYLINLVNLVALGSTSYSAYKAYWSFEEKVDPVLPR